jgi:Flp pilus assembly protein TadD
VFADLGAVLKDQGRLSLAVDSLTRALSLKPDDPQLLVNRGWVNEALDRVDAAAADFSAALALDERNAEAFVGLAYIDARRGRNSDAQRRAALALLHGGNDYLILHNVACVYAKLATAAQTDGGASQEQAAIDLLSRAVSNWRGAWTGPNELELIEIEVAFPASMRARPEFKRLISEGGGNGA